MFRGDLMKTYYIYKATNKINGKSYIGQTCDFKSRVWQHMRCYEKEDCTFHRALQKYGEENFTWEVLETCNTREESLRLERYYIEFFDTYHNGYNENRGGVGGHNARSVVMLTVDGKFVKRYDSACDAQKDGFHDSDVLLCCKSTSRKQLCKGYMFMFEDEYLKNGARKYIKPLAINTKSVIQCDMDGNFIAKFRSVNEAAEKTGAYRPTISMVLCKKYKSANGFIFVYENEFPIKDLSIYKVERKGRKIAQVNAKSGEIIKLFDRISDAGKELGVNYKSIHKVLDMPNRTAYGYKWISQYANTEVND